MIIVTGGSGFIGSNLIRALNRAGREDLIVVDDMTDGRKFCNIADCIIADYLDKDDFRQAIAKGATEFGKIDVVFHQGACTDTTIWDGRFMLDNNYQYSKELMQFCVREKTPFIYASSASVYGVGKQFAEQQNCENPVNVYAYSKLLIDNYARNLMKKSQSQIVGLRYFNVYGRGEEHKQSMASVAFQFNQQILGEKRLKLFAEYDGYAAGQQSRDFIHVDDVVAINLWFMEKAGISGIFNAGTGNSYSFNDVAQAILKWHDGGEIEYIPFPEKLAGSYQSYTKADLTQLRNVGCSYQCKDIEVGMKEYLDWLNKDNG